MNSANDTIHHDTPMNNTFNIHENNLLLSASMLSSEYSVSSLKDCAVLQNGSNAEYLQKSDFIPEIAGDIDLSVDFVPEHRYRINRQLNIPSTSYEMKSLNHDVQNISFTDELRSLNRENSSVSSSFNYYPKNISPEPDIYNQEFPTDFTGNHFSNNLPSTSNIFPSDDSQSYYVISDSQSDEMLLNGIELNEPEKLISLLNNEELDASRHGNCFEVILNNGEVLYAVVDSENEFSPSVRLMQIPKDMLVAERQCSLPVTMDPSMPEHLTEAHYQNSINGSSNFSSKSPNGNFDINPRNYTSLSKTISSSSIGGDNFNLCCDFSTTDTNQFPSDLSSYSTMVSSKAHSSFDEPSLSKTDVTYTCASGGSSTEPISVVQTEPTISSSTTVPPSEQKIDYFPSAVNSIVVSETGKKYPKKYSFYSNNFSFHNQESSSFDKTCPKTGLNTSELCPLTCTNSVRAENIQKMNAINEAVCTNIDRVAESMNTESMMSSNSSSGTNMHSMIQLRDSTKLNSSIPPAGRTSHISVGQPETFCHIDLVDEEEDPSSTDNDNFIANNLLGEEQILRSKLLNSRISGAVNSICDQAVQSRARATLPTTYLSINRIKNKLSNDERPTYGVFARQTIPGRTQFGPIEGVLVKTEDQEEEPKKDTNNKLLLTVEIDGKFWRLDVSNEDVSNWMRFVRPATCYKEQNLMLSQQGSSLYFTSIEVIHPKQELLVWYGSSYSRSRNCKPFSDDPFASVPYEIIDRIDDLSSFFNPDKNAIKETFENNENFKNSGEEVALNNGCEGSAGENTAKEMISKQNSRVTKKLATECATKKQGSRKCDKSNKSLWLCDYCDLTFSNGAVMNLHVLSHSMDESVSGSSSTPPSIVNGDGFTFNSQELTCPQCNQTFVVQKELISHVAKHGLKVQRWTDNKTVESVSDDKSKCEKDDIDQNSTSKKFQCHFCKKVLKNSVALNIHERIHSENAFLECPICDATFEKLSAMKEHVHTHAENGIFTCPHCPKTYDRYKVIRKHIRSVHVTAKYVCKQCKKSFRSQYKLRTHMLKHSDIREFLCANCGKQFKRIDKLTEHIKNIHSEERERKNMEIMDNALANRSNKKMLKKKVPNKVLRLITENVNDYFYKCYVCNIGFKRRGMLVNHINMFHPTVSLDSIPELNVPILKAYCNFFCQYCDRVYKSNSKRKAHIMKSHPGAKIPGNSERGAILNDPYSKHVKNVVLDPFNCDYCYRQYASRAKLLSHHRKDHADLIPSDMKLPRHGKTLKKKRKVELKKKDELDGKSSKDHQLNLPTVTENDAQLQSMQFEISAPSDNVNLETQQEMMIQDNMKDNSNDPNQATHFQQLLTEELRNSISQEQYLKILQSFNGIAIAQTDENSSTILQHILTPYSFSSS